MTSLRALNLTSLPRRLKIALMMTGDLLALPLCFALALLLRAGNRELIVQYGIWPPLFIAACTIPVFSFSGLYRTVLRYIDLKVLWAAGVSMAAMVGLTYGVSFLINDSRLPRAGLLIYWFIAFAYVVISRFLIRAILRRSELWRNPRGRAIRRVGIFGAGEAGFQLVNAMRASVDHEAICFFDDDQSLDNHTFADLTVYHTSRMRAQLQRLNIDEVVLAVPSLSPEQRKRILDKLHRYAVSVRTLPTLLELVDRKITMQSIREVKVEDLLGRPAVPPREALFAKCTHRKVVMVTGAGGSIGSELCRQVATQQPRKLILFDHSEWALYMVEQDLRRAFPEVPLMARIGSVCDAKAVAAAMQGQQVDTIYHAAAYKHVPLVEGNMPEGIRNNVLGAQTIVNMADRFGVRTCVLISTDKAVRPTNVMGTSKRIAELIFQAAAARPGTRTVFSMVRFGNVLGSSGSVVPLFRSQIEAGGPITITHPDVIRFFMLIPEASQLVIQAGAMARGGEVFVLDMGQPVRIIDLARTMIEMAGLVERNAKNPNGDIEIKFVGLRPGEKLYEELLIGGNVAPSDHERIMRSQEPSLEEEELHERLIRLHAACEGRDELRIQMALQAIVPEYAPYTSLDEPGRARLRAVPVEAAQGSQASQDAQDDARVPRKAVLRRVASPALGPSEAGNRR
ncbi:nucleoside-diphosphate sugar epimerase/dehydratase [Cupriavidus sp. WKF15]|uniref:polysaccharide biosynthesis protein n=1 Tax=Cupriavidus sp. WKF15 TaxID=3032282 RepID=UPI0023E2A2B0|nr:nucleoside-diphosphate sugar epimerase/dehydratase [Cupriavidus sp. WKF15]WER49580.1 nucleoside-diphosphate sugar epimerase/dehydratase [Cupriavidus sp. WKF15]